MALYEDTLVDANSKRPIGGASVYVYGAANGAIAALTDGSNNPIGNPVTTGIDGGYSFNAPDGMYNLVYVKNGRELREISNVAVGSGGVAPSDLATLAASSGAGLVGFDAASTYSPGSLGARLQSFTTATGASLIGFQASGTGATVRNVRDKLRETVSAWDFGLVADGVTDDTAHLQGAINSLGAVGGTVVLPRAKVAINGNLTVKPNVSLVGPHEFTGSPANNASAPYGNVGGALLVSSTATITLMGGASLTGLLIYRQGMTFPALDTSAFAGTAITAGGDDVAVSRCMVLGFAKAFYSTGFQRQRIDYLYHDNLNGVEIASCADISMLRQCHAWPFSTIAGSGTLQRSGKAYHIHDVGDWAKLSDCFSYGYFRGIVIDNANSVTLLNCGTDNTYASGPTFANSIGIQVSGTSTDVHLIGCSTAAQATAGVYINTSAGVHTNILGHRSWGGSTHGVLIDGGDASVSQSTLRGVSYGVTVTSTASRVTIKGNRFQDLVTAPFSLFAATPLVTIGRDNDFGNYTGSVGSANLICPTVASASALAIGNAGNTINVTGTTGITTITGGWAGREVTLLFAGVLTVTSATGTTNSVRLSGGTNYTSSAGSSLTIRHNGVQWYEIGRSA